MEINQKRLTRPVQIWLFIGIILVFVQVVIGGITRLTDSGLSITEWEVISGVLPPTSLDEWELAFDKYKDAAKKQHESLHSDMTLSEFKVIYFWEWFHRLWARSMGLIFIGPFVFFLFKKQIPKWLLKDLLIVVGLASLAAIFGWIMVKSGLNDDNRTWVSAYKLLTHLLIATVLFGYLSWTWFKGSINTLDPNKVSKGLKKLLLFICCITFIQIGFGALMAGMRAGLIHPYFPFVVKLKNLLSALDTSGIDIQDSILNYESDVFAKAIVQVIHRLTAYILSGLIVIFFVKARRVKDLSFNRGSILLIVLLVVQFLLGVLTIINCKGAVPLGYGVLHQAGALILFGQSLYLLYKTKRAAYI